jgi:hypothetical protein
MSSPATLLSVVCYGVQDSRLITPRGQPNINHYVKVFKKTTRWAAQWIRVDFDGTPDLGKRNTCTIPRKGELLSQITLVVTMPDIATVQQNAKKACPPGSFIGPNFGWTNSLGHALISLAEFDIGGVNVDRFDGRYMEIYDELYESNQSVRAKNRMIHRVANGFNASSIGSEPGNPTICYVPIPFWFSKNEYENALPIDALSADLIQVNITLRPVNELYYSDARYDSRNPFSQASVMQDTCSDTATMANSKFYRANPDGNITLYKIDPTQGITGISGEVIPGYQMAGNFNLQDAYLLCEYISLEEYEATLFRSNMLEYRVEQHYIVPAHETQSGQNVRIQLPYSNPVKEIHWVCQNSDVKKYNSWFLFTREMYSAETYPEEWWKIPWWPDAVLTSSDASLPAFRNAYSEPIEGVELTYNNIKRFSHQSSPSIFRSLLPIIHYRKAPLFNRYIYTFPFALAPGANDDKSLGAFYNPRGFSNFDKLPKKELHITMKRDSSGNFPNLTIYTYVTTWNVFRVFGGRGVMLFAY